MADYVSRRDPEEVMLALDEIADEIAADGSAFAAEAAHRTFERSEW